MLQISKAHIWQLFILKIDSKYSSLQVRRLKRHPSIAIWSGNNENEGALSNNWLAALFQIQWEIFYLFINLLVCSGSVVVTAHDSESGRPGSDPEWGLIYYMRLRSLHRAYPSLHPFFTLHYVISYANYTYSDQWCINKVIQVLRMRA